jgi:hypothetical protein
MYCWIGKYGLNIAKIMTAADAATTKIFNVNFILEGSFSRATSETDWIAMLAA